jgi:hypothetical protein
MLMISLCVTFTNHLGDIASDELPCMYHFF